MAKSKELKAFAIGNENFYQVVICHSKEIAVQWLGKITGISKKDLNELKVWEFPMDKKVLVRDLGETTAKDLIEEVRQSESFRSFPIVVFWKNAESDYYENCHSKI
ncbi:hypothetical protein [Bacillus sp. FJAT-27245]|uniref:hypothetical protein n=1 Tax=Bacillus sp. FJAT-27245 TaxID=1684144 RepID=UPI0006A76631|nr:hypothetical protein [Bacillus sp. FJAT-27245]